MSVSAMQETAFTSLYSLARKSGLFNTRAGQRLFSRAYFLYKRHIEDPFYRLAVRHPELFRGGNVLDIGANIGYTSSVFARVIDPAYKVYSFEPEEFNFRLLDRLAKSRQFAGRIVPLQAAAGDADGTGELWLNERHHGDHRIVTAQFRQSGAASVQVPIMRVDTFVERQSPSFPVCFIKIDVQGYELPVCRGMERTLQANPQAAVALEYSKEGMEALGFQPDELLAWLPEQGYCAYQLEKDGLFAPVDYGRINEQSYGDLIFIRSA